MCIPRIKKSHAVRFLHFPRREQALGDKADVFVQEKNAKISKAINEMLCKDSSIANLGKRFFAKELSSKNSLFFLICFALVPKNETLGKL